MYEKKSCTAFAEEIEIVLSGTKQRNILQASEIIFIQSFYAPINSKVQHPPQQPPRAFELLKIGLFKFPPLGAKKPFKCPTN